MAELATLRRAAELEATAVHRAPVVELTTPLRHLRAEMAALRKERDDLAENLAQIKAYQPGIIDAARTWVARIDKASGGAATTANGRRGMRRACNRTWSTMLLRRCPRGDGR